MIIWRSINCPTVICSPTVCYFSQEKPLVKSMAPGSLSHIICLCNLFYLHFISRSIKPKNTKIPCCNLFCLAFDLSIFTTLSRSFAKFWRRCPKGIDNPFNTSGCEYLLFVCRCCLRSVAWFSYSFDNLGLITKGNTYATVLHHPFLFKGKPTQAQEVAEPIPSNVFLEHLHSPSVQEDHFTQEPPQPKSSTDPTEVKVPAVVYLVMDVLVITLECTVPYIAYMLGQELPEDEDEARQIVRWSKAFTVTKG